MHIKQNPTLQKLILHTIDGKAKGIFLLAQLQITLLQRRKAFQISEKALLDLTEDLDDIYKGVMRGIKDQDPEDDVSLARERLT